MKAPLRIMDVRQIRDTNARQAASARRIAGRIVSLPGGQFCVAGRLFAARSDAEAFARKLDRPD